MKPEQAMRKRVVKALVGRGAFSVENGCGVGTPDVCIVGHWLELKVADMPAREDTPLSIPHWTPQQKVWHLRWFRAGGESWVLLKVGDMWALLTGFWAATQLEGATWKKVAQECVTWQDSETEAMLRSCFQRT